MTMLNRTDRLGEENIKKLLMEFSVPATVGMLVNALYNIIDRMYIGNSPDLGPLGIAGITIGFPLTIILMALALLFGVGGATMFSIHLGEKRPEQAGKYLGNAVTMLIVTSGVFMIISLMFLQPLMQLLGASPDVMPYAKKYMEIVLWGSIIQALTMGLNNFIRADGSPKIAMVSMFLGAGFNIVFDPIFIYAFRWGMTGAALATVGGQLLTLIWIAAYFSGKRCANKILPQNMKPECHVIKKILETGTPTFLTQLANSLLNVILNRSLIIYGGDIAVSGIGVINSIQTFMLMPVFGISQGAQPIIGYNFGAGKTKRVKEGLKWAVIFATVIVVIGWLITRLFPGSLVGMFSRDTELAGFGGPAIRIWFLCLPLVGFQMVSASYFQAVGKARTATFLASTRQLIILIPAVIILPKLFGLNGILYAAPLADFLSSVITGIWLRMELRHLNFQIRNDLVIKNKF